MSTWIRPVLGKVAYPTLCYKEIQEIRVLIIGSWKYQTSNCQIPINFSLASYLIVLCYWHCYVMLLIIKLLTYLIPYETFSKLCTKKKLAS